MKSICFFSSYFTTASIPYAVQVYLLELVKHFDEVVFLTNEKKISIEGENFLKQNNIALLLVKNEGFDFGMWSKAFTIYDVEKYQQVALVNDSCILFAPLTDFFNWVNKSDYDYCGFTESYAISYHIQSYFLVLNNKAVKHAKLYFDKIGILPDIKSVIEKYEVGLSTYLLASNLKLGAFLSNNNYRGEFSPYYYLLESHLRQGSPLIKKKIIYSSYRTDELTTLLRMNFNIHAFYYTRIIKALNKSKLILDFDTLNSDAPQQMNSIQMASYDFKKGMFQFLKKLLRK